ncbi:hypothetical protein E5161_02405 [Cohnella pontilimi]|uniref:Uncharacterized protein n=1 Tax=Cohnella pontilimi TaxID=2564100 RepID=A0A4V6WEJ2_9BACL|nr:hypothetical protein [Cohnella pontilimi]TJY44259.1 hypothetical protein E5161_02405 [Cohnella pontilimi]
MSRLSVNKKHRKLRKPLKRGNRKRAAVKSWFRKLNLSRKKMPHNRRKATKSKPVSQQNSSLVSGSLYDRLFQTDDHSDVKLNANQHMVDRGVWERICQALPEGYTLPDPDFYRLIKTNIRLPQL